MLLINNVLTLHISNWNSILFHTVVIYNLYDERVFVICSHLILNNLYNKRLNCVNFPPLDRQKIQFNSL